MSSSNRFLRTALLTGVAVATVVLGTARPANAAAQIAFGDSVAVTTETATTNDFATISFSGLPAWHGHSAGTPLVVHTAPVLMSGTFGTARTAFSNLLGYCTDLYDFASAPVSYTVGTLANTWQKSSGGTPLTAFQVNEIANLINANYKNQAATQFAIWAVEYGSAFSFTDATGTTAADVATYMSALNGNAPKNVVMYQLQVQGVQGFAFLEPVPEPMSIALLTVGMIGTGILRRRRACQTPATA